MNYDAMDENNNTAFPLTFEVTGLMSKGQVIVIKTNLTS
jgi:hypothetical protein